MHWFNNYTIFHELNQMQMCLCCSSNLAEISIYGGLGPWKKAPSALVNAYMFMCSAWHLTIKTSNFSFFCPLSAIRVWDVVSELVCLCTVPSPSNPFALDMRYIKSLPLAERFLVTGALLNFLEMYVVYGNRDELHYDKGANLYHSWFTTPAGGAV